jgi:hypothetical protein
MAETILGIDAGSCLIKLVQIERSMQGATIRKMALVRSGQLGEPKRDASAGESAPAQIDPHEQLARIIARVVADKGLASDRIILGIPPRQVFVRQLTFPFTSSSKIAQVLDFELESMLPLPMERLISVFARQGKTKTGEQIVLAGSMVRDELAAIIQAFREAGLHVEVIDLAWHGMLALLKEDLGSLPDPLVIVDGGWSGTDVFLIHQGQIVEHRFAAMGISFFLEDQDAKDRGETVSEPAGAPPPALREQDLAAWTEKIVSLIGLATMTRNLGRQRPEQIVLCGGGSLVEGLGPGLELALHIPVQTMGELKEPFFKGVDDPSVPWSLMHNAAGLALRTRKQDFGFNFRIKEFAPQTTFRDRRRRLVYLGVCVFLLLGVYLVTLVSDLRHTNAQVEMFDREIRSRVLEVLSDAPKGMRPSQYISILKDRLAVFDAGGIDEAEAVGSAIDVLQALSSLVDASFNVTLDMFALDGDKVRISGLADGFATVEAMKQRLQSSPFFTAAVIKGAKSVAKDGKVQFTVELERG